ncbi:MAG: hypothetical protein P8Y24_02780 [Gammaproteobacteria bacterium]|jgi:hypothetical protein
MADVRTEIDTNRSLTTITARGQLTADDILKAINDFYKKPTRLVLWDVNGCTLDDLSAIDLENASKAIARTKNGRPEGKTAFVIEKDNFGLGVLFEGFAKIENLPYEYRSFTSREEAMHWLNEKY